MKIIIPNKKINKVKTRVELLELLKQYRWILSNEVAEYFESLIDLESSVIAEPSSFKNKKNVLGELDIYKQIAVYNIYNKALNMFESEDENEFNIYNNEAGYEGLSVYKKDRGFPLYDFEYGSCISGEIADIYLFRTIGSKEKRNAEIDRILEELEYLYRETNPYPSYPERYGGPSSMWAMQHADKIKSLEKRLEELDSKKELSNEDLEEIRITNEYRQKILDNYKLTDEDFVDESDKYGSSLNRYAYRGEKRIKRLKNINIIDHTKYI